MSALLGEGGSSGRNGRSGLLLEPPLDLLPDRAERRPADWVSLLANGSAESLRRLASIPLAPWGAPLDLEWEAAAKFLARLISDEVAVGSFSLFRFQCSVLAPLEGALESFEDLKDEAPHPSWLVREVLAAVDRCSRVPQDA